MKRSLLELQLEGQIEYIGLPTPEIEYIFHPDRLWRFDFAWPKYMIAVEVEGGIYNGGRHVTPKGFTDDCIKYNEATILGWRIIRITSSMINDYSGINFIARIMGIIDEEKTTKRKSRKTKT